MFYTTIDKINSNKDFLSAIGYFAREFNISKLLYKCNASKDHGIPVLDIFNYYMSFVFTGLSMYMQMATNSFNECFSKNTVYRFLNNAKTNWNKFVRLLSKAVIYEKIEYLTSPDNKKVFIIDDTTIEKPRSKKTELMSVVHDHTTGEFVHGFKLLGLGYSDGISFLPIEFNVHAGSSDRNILCPPQECDKRTLAYARRQNAVKSKLEMSYSLLEKAQNDGIIADYVLVDSWFAQPSFITSVKKNLLIDVICRLKRNEVKYMYNDEKLSIKEIYRTARKRPGKSTFLLSIQSQLNYNDFILPVKIIFVRNINCKKDWVAILSTDTSLSEEEIIQLYQRRWDIECFFKVCKSYLKLVKGFRSLSFDTLNTHVAMVYARFIFLSLLRRCSEDKRTMGELFACVTEELKQRDVIEAIIKILKVSEAVLKETFHFTDEQYELYKKEMAASYDYFYVICQKILSLSQSIKRLPVPA